MSPAFKGSLAIQHFEYGDALKIFDEMIFNFNPGKEIMCHI